MYVEVRVGGNIVRFPGTDLKVNTLAAVDGSKEWSLDWDFPRTPGVFSIFGLVGPFFSEYLSCL